jgi:hypothetical protein
MIGRRYDCVRRWGRPALGTAVVASAACAVLLSPALAPAALSTPPVSPADAAATYAYLQANYRWDQAILRNAAMSRSDAASFASQLSSECHGVLSGAPREGAEPPSASPPAPRARGERQRSELQLETIEEELDLSVDAATYQPDRPAVETFAAQVAQLSWSNPRIAPLAHFKADTAEELFAPASTDVCADMKTWAQSGYHILSAASREFEATRKARSDTVEPRGSLISLLKPYEGSRARRLIRDIRAVVRKIETVLAGTFDESSRLQRSLGLQASPFEERRQQPVLGRGTTDAGGTFVVRRAAPKARYSSSCQRSVAVELTERSKGSTGLSDGYGTSVCLTGHSDQNPSSHCSGEVASITAAVPASVRTVQLLLSNGQTLTSSVIKVPRKAGGPGGVYVQAVRGPSPYPVSLTELDARGKVVLTVKLATERCRREPTVSGPAFVDLAKGTTPDGEPFTIEGVLVRFGRNQTSFSLSLSAGLHSGRSEIEVGNVKPRAFKWSLGMECQPHEFAIVYGILSAPGASVLARTPEGLVPLTNVPLASDLHSEGPLVYGAFSTLPSELVVRRGDGSTLYTESLAVRGKEEAEFCAGYAEG